MNLTYTKLTADTYKFFYQDEKNGYGEFYIRFGPGMKASLDMKDWDYSQSLIKGLAEALIKPAPNYEEVV